VLPLPVIFALLRLVRGRSPEPGDEDVLFDEFGVCGVETVLSHAAARLAPGGASDMTHVAHRRSRDAQVDAVLVDMLREIKAERVERRALEEAA
jgi:hypothetical protein